MSAPIAIALSPNVETDDIQQAWHTLTHPQTWEDESITQQTAHAFSSLFPGSFTALTASGRSALYLTLKALGVRSGDEVIMQAFTCIAVPEPVLWLKAKPVYVDMLPRAYTMNPDDLAKKITGKTKAIIMQHTFGIPANIENIVAIAKEHHIPIIEDCAHALGSTYQDKRLGTFGQAAIFSFGRDKSVSSVFGGAVMTNDRPLFEKIHTEVKALPLPKKLWVVQQVLHPLITSLALRTMGPVPLGQGIMVVGHTLGLLSKAVDQAERQGARPYHLSVRYSPALSSLLKLQLEKISAFTTRRQALGQRYYSGLSSFDFSLPAVLDGSNPAWLRFPILIKNRAKFLAEAKNVGMHLGDWYDAPLVPANASLPTFQYEVNSCPQAEEAARHVINLPTYPSLTDGQVDHIIEFTKQHAQPYYETR